MKLKLWGMLGWIGLLAAGWIYLALPGRLPIDDFDTLSGWTGLTAETALVRQGTGAARWANHPATPGVQKIFTAPVDASGMDFLHFWLYSGVANGAQIELILDSENAGSTGWDYYRYQIVTNWTGWRYIHIPKASFAVARQPVGWNQLNYIRFSADGWSHTPLSDTLLVFDDLSFSTAVISVAPRTSGYVGADFVYTYSLRLQDRTGAARTFQPELVFPVGSPLTATAPAVTLPASGTVTTTVLITVPAAAIQAGTQFDQYQVDYVLLEGGRLVDGVNLEAAIPWVGAPAPHPRLLLNAADFTRIASWRATIPWATQVVSDILRDADAWPRSFTETYYLTNWSLPPEGGQWGMWYICPNGEYLVYQSPGRHYCPSNGQYYTGWPYDQVIYGRMHNDLAEAARDLGLAYRITGNITYAQRSAEILLAYADAYTAYPYHDINNAPNNSGGRVLAQTLDESIWAVPIAWAYDLIADSPALTGTARLHVEQDLLAQIAVTIRRHPAGMSNWQSWHNAGLAAVGWAMGDPIPVALAMDAPRNGFNFQMANSVSAEGFWYEGSWGYHFFALQALRFQAEMARRATPGAGLDLFAEPSLRKMYEAPINFAQPDLTLPSFNDTGSVGLIGESFLYESACSAYGGTLCSGVLGRKARGRESLFWGMATLPAPTAPSTASVLFPEAGYGVLRNAERAAPVYVALDYGPHGGGHGHYDKLGFVLFGQGTVLGVDPGTQSYAAPTHATWDKVTVAHNTVVVDGLTQAEATGNLHRFVALPGLSAAAADAGSAYTTTSLLRTLILGTDYVIDRMHVRALDGKSHGVDWVYHNNGTLTTTLVRTPYPGLPTVNGYQHITRTAAVTTAADWAVEFRLDDAPGTAYGSAWASDSRITATATLTQGRAAAGIGSWRLGYDFSATAGLTTSRYIVYSAGAPTGVSEVPTALQLAVYGEGSGMQLRLRLIDTNGEKYVTTTGVISWTGWRVITATNVVSWSHWQGDNNGVFDGPVSDVAVDVIYQTGAPLVGAIYVDDIVLFYPAAGRGLLADFEPMLRGLHLQMLGEAGTTIVTGEGLGPNLKKLVPLAMARRQMTETTFVALLEPESLTPTVRQFAALATDAVSTTEPGAFLVATVNYTDSLLVLADGVGGTLRHFGAAACDGVLCLVRREPGGALQRTILAEGRQLMDGGTLLITGTQSMAGVQVDYVGTRLALTTNGSLPAQLWLWGPEITAVQVNGQTYGWSRQGEYVVLGVKTLYLPVVMRNKK